MNQYCPIVPFLCSSFFGLSKVFGLRVGILVDTARDKASLKSVMELYRLEKKDLTSHTEALQILESKGAHRPISNHPTPGEASLIPQELAPENNANE